MGNKKYTYNYDIKECNQLFKRGVLLGIWLQRSAGALLDKWKIQIICNSKWKITHKQKEKISKGEYL